MSAIPSKADVDHCPLDVALGPRRRHDGYRVLFTNGFATSRAVSMKSCATGLSTRFFSVMISARPCVRDCLTGKILSSVRVLEKLSTEDGKLETKRPVASRL